MNPDKHLIDELARQEIEGVVPPQKFDPARAVVIRRRSDGAWLTHLAGPVTRFQSMGAHPIQFFSRARAELIIRCDMGGDLDAFDILPAAAGRMLIRQNLIAEIDRLAAGKPSTGTPASRRASIAPTAPAGTLS